MKSVLVFPVILSVLLTSQIAAQSEAKVVCYYDSKSFHREGLGRVGLAEIEPALPYCSHLVYGYADIDGSTFQLEPSNSSLELDQGQGYYRMITGLKIKYPKLKILLSVGGDSKDSPKYLNLLEKGRSPFISSAYAMIKNYNFDGLDLSWAFPVIKPKTIRGGYDAFFHKIKTLFSSESVVDNKWEEHREEFTVLVRELKQAFESDKYLLTTTVLPNVNSSLYYDAPVIIKNLDFVVLAAFDFQTFERNPKEADYPAPLYELHERHPESNVNYQVSYWTTKQVPETKIIVGIPAFGRAWRMVERSGITGVPPLRPDKRIPIIGNYTKTPGLLSWPEICTLLPNPSNMNRKGEDAPLRRVHDPTKRFGTYAYRLPDETEAYGLWVGYDDPDSAGNKAGYVRAKSLGGVGIFDLSMDDYRGYCAGDKFPIVRAAKYRL